MSATPYADGAYAPGCWAVIAYRWGWLNDHQYIVRVTTDLQEAQDAADAEAAYRGGKYGVTVWDKDGAAVHHAPSCYGEKAAHINYRVEMFETVGREVVCAIEEESPMSLDAIAARWRRAVRDQEIMEKADPKQPNIQAEGREPRKGNDEDSATVIASALNRLADINGLAHELFAVAQLMPGEGIEDAVNRIEAVLIGSANKQAVGTGPAAGTGTHKPMVGGLNEHH